MQSKQMPEKRSQCDRILLLGQSAAGILHDANNQMMLIQGVLGLMLLEKDDEQAKKQLKAAQQAVVTVSELLRQVMRMAKPKLGEDVAPEGLFADDEINHMLPLVRAAVGPGIRLVEQTDAQEDLIALNLPEFQSLVLNLIINARNAMEGTGEIRIRSETVDRNGLLHWMFVVEDTGRGIDPDIADLIFQPSWTTGAGRGLGLMRCKQIVESAGGHIAVSNRKGRGACFSVWLPLLRQPALLTEEPPILPGSGRILVMMGSALEQVIHRMLRALGYEVLLAPDLARLRETVGTETCDMAILDERTARRSLVQMLSRDCPLMVITTMEEGYTELGRPIQIVNQPITLARFSQIIHHQLH